MNYNFDLEYSIIGILLTSKNSMKYLGSVKAEMFYNNSCRELFTKAMECSLTNEEFTPYIAIEHLKSIGQAEETATNNVLKCSENVITSYTLKSDLRLLQELYRKRELANILKAGIDTNEDFEVTADKILQQLYDLRRANKSSKKTVKNMLEATTEYFEHYIDKTDKDKVNTGYPLIDSMLKGMHPGELIGLAGRPGTGKSVFALNVAIKAAQKQKKVIIFSQEMQSIELIERMTSSQALIEMDNLIAKKGDETKVLDVMNYLSKLPIYIADTTTLTTMKIRNECQQISDLKLIIIDYLTLMTPMQREQSKNYEIGQITRELKNLANDLQCPILLLSQLNRVKDETQRPSLNDYRDSGSIEQDINKSIMLWKIDAEKKHIGLTINKNRRGSCGDVELKFDGNYMMFKEIGLYKEPLKKKNKVDWSKM